MRKQKFEIFFLKDKISSQDWKRVEEAVVEYDSNVEFEVVFSENLLRFFIYSEKDLGFLFNRLKDVLLKRQGEETVYFSKVFEKVKPIRSSTFKLSSGDDILKVLEKMRMKKEEVLEAVYIKRKKFLGVVYYQIFLVWKRGTAYFYNSYISFFNPLQLFSLDFSKHHGLKKQDCPLELDISSISDIFTSKRDLAILQVESFPYFSQELFLSLESFDFLKHTLIVGQTGVGKSKFIELFVKRLYEFDRENYSVVLIDPHASLDKGFQGFDKITFDFVKASCRLFLSFAEAKIATELTILLFKTLLEEAFNSKLERVLKYSLYVLFKKNQMSINTLKKFLTEIEFRKKVLEGLPAEDEFLKHFFETEFNEIATSFYEKAIMPILVLIDEISFVPALVGGGKDEAFLEEVLKDKFLVSIPLSRIYLGEKATKLIAGLIIQQVFLIAQKRSVNKKIILIIDEVSTVENEALISILSEARKFNLGLFLSQQYLTQVSSSLLKAMLSNVYNFFVFKVADEDAKILAENLVFKFPEFLLEFERKRGRKEQDLKKETMVSLNPREVVARVFAKGEFTPAFKGRTVDV